MTGVAAAVAAGEVVVVVEVEIEDEKNVVTETMGDGASMRLLTPFATNPTACGGGGDRGGRAAESCERPKPEPERGGGCGGGSWYLS